MKIAYNPKDVTPLTGVSSDSQDIIFDLSGMAIYARGIKFSGTDTTYEVFTSTTTGLVPVPGNNNSNRFLREDGTWAIPLDGVQLSELFTSLSSSVDTNLSITVGGVTKSITSLYSKNAMSFYTPWNNPTSGSYNLNSHLLGMARYYGSGGTLLNAPSSFGYGSILALSTGTASLSG
jgi:hypothetical protein